MEWTDWLRAAAALAATLALMGLAALAARRLGMARSPFDAKARRMSVSERLMIDPRRQMVIVRVDGEEHVLLLSPGQDVLVASRPAQSTPEAAT